MHRTCMNSPVIWNKKQPSSCWWQLHRERCWWSFTQKHLHALTAVPAGLPTTNTRIPGILWAVPQPFRNRRRELQITIPGRCLRKCSYIPDPSHPGLSHDLVGACSTHQVNEVTEILLYLLWRQTPHQIQGTIQLLVTLQKQKHPSVTVCTDKHKVRWTGTVVLVNPPNGERESNSNLQNVLHQNILIKHCLEPFDHWLFTWYCKKGSRAQFNGPSSSWCHASNLTPSSPVLAKNCLLHLRKHSMQCFSMLSQHLSGLGNWKFLLLKQSEHFLIRVVSFSSRQSVPKANSVPTDLTPPPSALPKNKVKHAQSMTHYFLLIPKDKPKAACI